MSGCRKNISKSHAMTLNPVIQGLLVEARKTGCFTEMAAVLGFLLENESILLKDTASAGAAPIHPYYDAAAGNGVRCLKIFRDWCHVSPRNREAWSKKQGIADHVMERIWEFIYELQEDVPNQLNMVSFSKNAKQAEKLVMKHFLKKFFGSLSVYSGSPHIGFNRLTDGKAFRPSINPCKSIPKYALFFTLRDQAKKKATASFRKCTLYPSEDVIQDVIREFHLDITEFHSKSDEYYNHLSPVAVKCCPAVLEPLLNKQENVDEVEAVVKAHLKSLNNVPEEEQNKVYIHVDSQGKTLTCYTQERNHKSVETVLEQFMDDKKKHLMDTSMKFEYPEPGSGLYVEMSAIGHVKRVTEDIKVNPLSNSLNVFVCCKPISNLKERLLPYGEPEKHITEQDENIQEPGEKFWGKIHCSSQEKASQLLSKYHHWQGVVFRWARPALVPDGNGVEFLRVKTSEIKMPIKQVNLHLCEPDWRPAVKYIIIGKEASKIRWFEDGTGAFTLSNPYVSDKWVMEAIRSSDLPKLEVDIERDPYRKLDHSCFKGEGWLKSYVLDHAKNFYQNTNVQIETNTELKNGLFEEHHLDFIDVDKGLEFVKHFKETKRQRRGSPAENVFLRPPEYCCAFMVKQEVFDCVKVGLDVVYRTAKKNRLPVLFDSISTIDNSVLLKLHSRDRLVYQKVRKIVQKVLSREVIQQTTSESANDEDVNPLNFIYLKSYGGKYLIQRVEKDLDVKITFHSVEDKLMIYGPPDNRLNAKHEILAELKALPQPVVLRPPAGVNVSLIKKLTANETPYFNHLKQIPGLQSFALNSKYGGFLLWGDNSYIDKIKTELKALVANEINQQDDKDNTEKPLCTACFCPVEGPVFRLSLCGHTYCLSCISLLTDVAIQDRSLPIKCARESCKEPILISDVGRACDFSKEGLRKLLDAGVSLYIAQNGDTTPVRFCNTPDCPGVYLTSTNKYNGNKIACGVCKASICNCCQTSPFHDGYSCAMWKRHHFVDKEIAEWFSKDMGKRKLCPQCNTGIEKNGGCPCVHCLNCKIVICFECLEMFKDSSQCYVHLDKAHEGWM